MFMRGNEYCDLTAGVYLRLLCAIGYSGISFDGGWSRLNNLREKFFSGVFYVCQAIQSICELLKN